MKIISSRYHSMQMSTCMISGFTCEDQELNQMTLMKNFDTRDLCKNKFIIKLKTKNKDEDAKSM
jgi:hypothetical protein